jgi:glycogen debranching enzyme
MVAAHGERQAQSGMNAAGRRWHERRPRSVVSNQLPEVFAGFARGETGVPVEYPGAVKPQAWAAGAPLLALRTLLGLDAIDGELRSRPHLPDALPALELRRIEFRGKRVDRT